MYSNYINDTHGRQPVKVHYLVSNSLRNISIKSYHNQSKYDNNIARTKKVLLVKNYIVYIS